MDRALVLHVAKLASLSLSDTEADRLTGELGKIVSYIAQLEELDTRGVEPSGHARQGHPDASAWRKDEPRPCLSRDEALAQAPSVEGDGFSVPAFVEEK
jgi:aspartyl-tRNA(Asn)/glutamyl-tRNA(Gln) amidotransferase subunit C